MIIILDKPLFFWLGILAFLLLLTQIILGIFLSRGNSSLFKWHKIVAVTLLITVIMHGFLALILYF